MRTEPEELSLIYFTSGTTDRPKMVGHTNASYPIGHLSTMYWIGLRPGDVHLNISSPGWAKHAWSCLFAPWNAQASVLVVNQPRFAARPLLEMMSRYAATSFCAPATVWRNLIQEDLKRWPISLREAVAAGEPLNPEVVHRIREAWGSPYGTASDRPRPPLRSGPRRGCRSSREHWAGRCRATR